MKTYIFILLSLGLFSSSVFSQESTTSLICSGRYDNYSNNIRDVDINDGVIQIQKTTIKVGILGFSYSNGEPLNYKILNTSDSKISFQYLPENGNTMFGVLNRYSGDISLTQLSKSNSTQMEQIFKGKCVSSKKLF